MDTTVKALKNLYVALGGELADVVGITTIAKMINAIAELVGATESNETSEPEADENGEG